MKGDAGRIAAIAARLDLALEGTSDVDALAAVRSLERRLKARLSSRARGIDLFALPRDLPSWDELKLELVARAIILTGTVSDAAKVLGISRSTLYSMIEKGQLNAQIRHDVRLARALASTSDVARTQLRHNDRADPAARVAAGGGIAEEGGGAA